MNNPSIRAPRRKTSNIARAAIVSLSCVGLTTIGTDVSAGANTFARPGQIVSRAAATPVYVVPTRADALVDSIGVDSHFGMVNEPYVTKFNLIGPQLVASGIRHLRDAGTGTNYDARMKMFYSYGITHSLHSIIGDTASDIRAEVASGHGEADAIEGPNEYDTANASNPNWATNLRAIQTLLYKTVRADPAAKAISVLGAPLANESRYAILGNLDSIEDAGSIHETSCDYNPGTYHSDSVASWFVTASLSSPGKPIWTTEAGYTTDLTRPCSIPQDVAAKYDTRLIAQYWNDGGARLYFYQLADVPDDVMFGGKGMIDQYGNPKIQFTAVSSLLNLLSDRIGPQSPIVPLSYTVAGATTGLEQTLLQRNDGSYDLLLWLEVPSWNHDTRTRIPVAPQTIAITFAGTPKFEKLHTFTPTGQMTSVKLPVTGPTVQLQVTDSISVLHFH